MQDEPFLVLNSDNCYPTEALRQLREADRSAVVGFDRDALVANSNLTADRIAGFALDRIGQRRFSQTNCGEAGRPTDAGDGISRVGGHELLAVLRQAFSSRVAEIGKSPRGEFEIPDAVSHSMQELGERYQVLYSDRSVLDLSTQSDIAGVTRHLQGEVVRL